MFDEQKKQYTLERNNTIKKVPIKYKESDKTSKYRKEMLKKEILLKK
jgi:rRNA maturation protein Nop10